jgi:hypothetical protein
LAALPALADIQITGLYNTGVDSNGVPLAAGSVDPHYVLTAAPAPIVTPAEALVVGSFWAFPADWVANGRSSQWIGPSATGASEPPDSTYGNACAPNCNYSYTTTFDVSGGTGETSLTLGGELVSDNATVEILLNGSPVATDVNGTNATDDYAWAFLQPFSFTSNINEGSNTLTFVVNNWGPFYGSNPTGLQVEFGTVQADNVPEPNTIPLMVAMGSVLFLLIALKRKLA